MVSLKTLFLLSALASSLAFGQNINQNGPDGQRVGNDQEDLQPQKKFFLPLLLGGLSSHFNQDRPNTNVNQNYVHNNHYHNQQDLAHYQHQNSQNFGGYNNGYDGYGHGYGGHGYGSHYGGGYGSGHYGGGYGSGHYGGGYGHHGGYNSPGLFFRSGENAGKGSDDSKSNDNDGPQRK